MATKSKKFSVMATEAIFAALEALARKEERTVSQLSLMLIKEGIKNRGIEVDEEAPGPAPTPPAEKTPAQKRQRKKPE